LSQACCAERPTTGGAEHTEVTAHVSGDNKLEVLTQLAIHVPDRT